MYQKEFDGINSFLKGSAELLLREGRERITRGKVCIELPEPYMFKITNPTDRWVTIPARRWYATLPYAESLWLASGRNDMDFIAKYLRRMYDFSDDQVSMRGGYGPRMRHYNGDQTDYFVDEVRAAQENEVDQFKYILDCFKNDPMSRRAVITIGDPVKDCFELDGNVLKQSLDIPCTRMLHFMKDVDENKLNLIVTMRSNDFLWGASAVNIFNYTFMQEYFAAMLGMDVGTYYHIANNFHYYKDKQKMVESIAAVDKVESSTFSYNKTFTSLERFDELIRNLVEQEKCLRLKGKDCKFYHFEDPFFQDWYNVFYVFYTGIKVDFINPTLYNLTYNLKQK